jgi:hemolysin D
MSTIVNLRTQSGTTNSADRQFLPAALEILETPPSPIRSSLLVVICAFVVVALGWSYFSRIDIIAVAQGKLQPTGRVKVIQPLETSRVLEAKAQNGDEVHRGQVLVVLDPAEAAADVGQLAANLASYRAEVLRREAALTTVRSHVLSASLPIEWPDAIPEDIQQREEHVYRADILQLGAQIESLKAQSEQKAAERERLRTMIEAENVLIATLEERVVMRQTLIATNAGSKSLLLEALEPLQTQRTILMQQKGEMAEAEANMAVLARDVDRAYRTFIAENAQKLAEAARQAGDLAERLKKAEARLDHMVLTSPIDGTVQASTITTVGQVVTPGQDLMRVVSDKDALEVECYLPNKDIGFVKPGDQAILKVESFPFTRYGTVEAIVTRVARDAIPEPDAEQIENDGTRKPQAMSQAGAQRMQNLVFPVTLRPVRTTIDVDGTFVPLGAGMAVTAEIRTGSRRILEFLFSPIVKVSSEAMKER